MSAFESFDPDSQEPWEATQPAVNDLSYMDGFEQDNCSPALSDLPGEHDADGYLTPAVAAPPRKADELPAPPTLPSRASDRDPLEGYVSKKMVGSGAYGDVFEATETSTGKRVAIKSMSFGEDGSTHTTDARRMLREMVILRQLKHRNVVDLLNVRAAKEKIHLVLDYVVFDLGRLLTSNNALSTEHIAFIISQILSGVLYLHSRKVIHRDLKPQNVLIDGDCNVQICDFGLARVMDEEDTAEEPVQPRFSGSKAASVSSGAKFQAVTDMAGCHKLLEPPLEPPLLKAPSLLAEVGRAPTLVSGGSTAGTGGAAATGSAAAGGGGPLKRMKDNRGAARPLPPSAADTTSGSAAGLDSLQTTRPFCAAAPASSKRPATTLVRQYSQHVVTRWYRAPELCVLQPYGAAIDMWSVGCILGELYYLVAGAVKFAGKKQMALFPGRFTDGLSPNAHNSPWAGDQLNTIVNVIGTPDLDNLRRKGNKKLADKLSSMPAKRAIPLANILPWVPEDALDLISGLLNFAPQDRITAFDALQHPFVANNISKAAWEDATEDVRNAKVATAISDDVDKQNTETTALVRALVEAEADYHWKKPGGAAANKRQVAESV